MSFDCRILRCCTVTCTNCWQISDAAAAADDDDDETYNYFLTYPLIVATMHCLHHLLPDYRVV